LVIDSCAVLRREKRATMPHIFDFLLASSLRSYSLDSGLEVSSNPVLDYTLQESDALGISIE